LARQRAQVYIGIDIGSVTVKVVGVDGAGRMTGVPAYLRHDQFPSPVDALKTAFRQYLDSIEAGVAGVGTTGSGRELNKKVVGADLSRTEIFAHAAGVTHLARTGQLSIQGRHRRGLIVDRIGTVLEIGGQDAKVIIFGEDGIPTGFNMNTICSAGTGEFLRQLADETGIDLERFGQVALGSSHPARIDATCTVFSRRDFRHLTQKGVPLEDRLMGACRALVSNYLLNVVQSAKLREPIFFQGGVAFNAAVRRAFEERLGARVHLTPHADVVGALGMAVLVREAMLGNPELGPAFKEDFFERHYQSRVRYCQGCYNCCDLAQPLEAQGDRVTVLDTLGGRCEGAQNPKNVKETPPPLKGLTVPVVRESLQSAQVRSALNVVNPGGVRGRDSAGRYFAGIDGGSRGTKYALISSREGRRPADSREPGTGDLEIVTAGTVETSGDALRACLRALGIIGEALPPGRDLDGIGTTGSAGELFRDVVTRKDRDTSDLRVTEIVAHYAWASHWVPSVGTVVDIGGSDAKIIAVKDGGLDFAMNDKCAAGTGSFLEGVARRFQIPIEEFGRVALEARDPARVAGRCAVFGESDIIHKARIGFTTPELFLGLAFAVCRTYLSDVGRGKPLRVPIVAQGGTLLNQAVQHAFRTTLGLDEREFIVASDQRYVICAGALGAALMARGQWEQGRDTAFKGFETILGNTYRGASLDCQYDPCSRRCRGLVVLLENDRPIAGYKAIDCVYGLFSGMCSEVYQREHLENLLGAGVETEEALVGAST